MLSEFLELPLKTNTGPSQDLQGALETISSRVYIRFESCEGDNRKRRIRGYRSINNFHDSTNERRPQKGPSYVILYKECFYSFTPPTLRPVTKCRWRKGYTKSMGTAAITVMAARMLTGVTIFEAAPPPAKLIAPTSAAVLPCV